MLIRKKLENGSGKGPLGTLDHVPDGCAFKWHFYTWQNKVWWVGCDECREKKIGKKLFVSSKSKFSFTRDRLSGD